MEPDPIPSKGSILPILLIVGCMPILGCTGTGHFFPPTPPKNLKTVFTENIFGTDGVRLTWVDSNWSDDIGFTVYRDGEELANLDPFCLPDMSGDWVCSPAAPEYFDTDVSRGETHCYAVSSYYYDWFMDAIFGESDKCPQVCIDIPLQGFSEGRQVELPADPTSQFTSQSPEIGLSEPSPGAVSIRK